ncbi:MAG TPA: type II secretion system minor pseudopilin GspK [Ramlibacter sp.]|uniref:type II secretion system minor pseudopilin GspK n=1 Tax=Ramlibacter sp. TaxID=1917967 RepID=UPI002ED01FED
MRRRRGAALLVAMLTVTVVATLAAAALWQQWRSVEIESAERTRVQSGWILTGALDWARLILREDTSNVDHLGEPWAVPLQEARLGTFLAADPNSNMAAGDADNTFLSGEITDLQSRLNVASLAGAGVKNDERVESFRRLFELLGLPAAELARLAENLRFAEDINVDNQNAARASLPPQRVEQLAWLGVSPQTIAALEPYVTVLPSNEPRVNLNTAKAEVIYAVGRGISLADAQRLVTERERQHFRAVGDERKFLPEEGKFEPNGVSVNSQFFEVRGRLRIDNVVIEERSVVMRTGREVRTLSRERGAFEAFVPADGRR